MNTPTPLAMPRRKPVWTPVKPVVYSTTTGDEPREAEKSAK